MADSPAPPPSTPTAAETAGQLRLAEQLLLAHVENTPLVVTEWDHEGRLSRWNAQAERVFGWAAAEVLGTKLLDCPFVLEENRELAERLRADAAAGQARSVVTVANRTRAGALVWCEWYNSVLHDAAGRPSVLSLALDITERRATAEALALSQARVRTALDGAKMLAWDLDLVADRWETSADIPDFYGIERGPDYTSPEQALRAVHPDDVETVLAGRRRAIETGEPMRYTFRGRVPTPDGRPRWFSTRGQVLRDGAGRVVRIVAVTSDVTERKRAEEERETLNRQLQDAQRWESLGVLAGGVAHDFNNILTVVLGSAGLARRGLLPGSPAVNYLDQIEQACRRAAEVCRQMLAYAGRAHGSGTRTDLPALVRESAPLLDIPAAHATVRLDLDDPLPPVRADPAQVRQVLVNLVTNAAEATGRAGEVVVRAHAAEVPEGTSDADLQLAPPPGRYVVLTVTDRGPGMSPEVRARMFDPFFTTKFAGRGLGLAAVLGIVRTHKGGIRVSTAPGLGTTVSVYWPAAHDPAPDASVPVPAAPPTVAALVIDDEMFVREVTASTLEEMGFAALLAADGPSGLDLFVRHRDVIKVVVVDVMMPGMTGDEVVLALRRTAPTVPVVLVSGFTERRLLKSLGPRTEFLQKPFHPEDLMAVVRRLISEC
ncbi:MAG: PAS domain S-box protein [Planctomycetes bacterium]|nr:PAS domain S-box protein [Planctomycetota bacterium]